MKLKWFNITLFAIWVGIVVWGEFATYHYWDWYYTTVGWQGAMDNLRVIVSYFVLDTPLWFKLSFWIIGVWLVINYIFPYLFWGKAR